MSQDSEIRSEIGRLARLSTGGAAAMAEREQEVSRKRLAWWRENRARIEEPEGDRFSVLDQAYRIFYLEYLELDPGEVPIVERSERRLVIHSSNFCPIHHACQRLGLDTREVCRAIYERPVTDLLRRIHPDLRFSRNYEAIRPHHHYCEEIIELL